MSKFSDYLASQITPQMTLLEKFNLMIKFLQENNYISVFYSQENYNVQTESYQKEKVNLNGFTLHIGDCIVFSNGYYAFVETIGVNSFTIGNVLYFQGEQGVSVVGATISSGHLILTLSDGENVDAGNIGAVSSFSINSSQHLIVNYANGTTQDLGAIFSGNISINGWIEQRDFNFLSNNQSFNSSWLNGLTAQNVYIRFGVINKVLYIVVSAQLKNETENSITTSGSYPLFNSAIPADIASKIYRKDGTTCNVQALDNNGGISVIDIILSNSSGGELNRKLGLVYSVYATQFAIWMSNANFTVPAGQTYNLDARTFLLL